MTRNPSLFGSLKQISITCRNLKNGVKTLLRPIKPEDEILLEELFQSLSEETMRFRFFQVIKEMTHQTLTRYCNIDYNREIAIVAEIEDNNTREIIGVVRLILLPGQKNGEFAVVVSDQWQGHGLGSKLVDHIIKIGKDMNLKKINGDILSQNLRMLRLCTKKSFSMEPIDEEMTRATLDLS